MKCPAEKHKMKGAAATMETVILTLLLLFFLVIFIVTLNNEMNKTVIMNFRQSEVLKLENTYALLNKTMETTWHISAVQSVFTATDQSLLCGRDDAELLGDDALPPKYWYQYDKANGPKSIDKAESFISDPDGNANKYNSDEPSVCYPANSNALTIVEDAFEVFKEITSEFTVNGIIIKITAINTNFSFTGTGVESVSKQYVSLASTNGVIEEDTTNVNHIYTDFPKMIGFGRQLVHRLAGISDSFYPNGADMGVAYDPAMKYQDLTNPLADTSNLSYLSRMSDFLNNEIATLESASSFDKTKASIEYHDLELFAPQSGDENIFYAPQGFHGGLVFHYNVSINLNEGGVGGNCQFPPPENYQELIEQEVGAKEWIFDKNEYTNPDIVSLESAIIQQESSWNPDAISCAGARGLGQLMPATARDLGLSVPSYGTTNIFCGGRQWNNVPVCNAKTPELCELSDDRFIPEKNIMGSVSYLHQLFEMMEDHTDDKTELLKLVVASYNTGPGNVEKAISESGVDQSSVRYDDIKSNLELETQVYVLAVSGYYMCYGGSLPMAGNFYYYHDGKSNRFFEKPFSMEIKVEDYLPAIDCMDESIVPVRFFAWEKQPRYSTAVGMALGDAACCGGILWTCNAEIPGMSGGLLTGDSAGSVCGGILTNSGITMVCEDGGFNLIRNA